MADDNLFDFPSKDERIVAQCQANGEPYIVFRAKDFFSTQVLGYYEELITKYGPEDTEFHHQLTDRLNEFKAWQRKNTDKVRYPD